MVLPQGEENGYLHVKVPAKVRGKSRRGWKAWKRKWVVVHGMTGQATKDPIVTIDMYCNESRQGQLERSTVYLEKVKVIKRTISKTHAFAFTVESENGEPLLHLAGKSETDSQNWIQGLRQLLWPPTFRAPVEGGIGIVYEVSIIESLSTPTFNNDAQTVGYMMLLPSVILLTSLVSGSILIEWPWYMFSQVVLITTQNEEDERKIVLIQIISEGSADGKYFFFSEKAENIYDALISKLESSEGDRSSVQTLTRTSICQKRSSAISHRKLSLESLGSKKIKQSRVQTITTTSSPASSSDEDSVTFTKSQSLLSITNEDSHNEEPLIEVQLRHKAPPKTNLSYDNIIVQKTSSKYLSNRRKSHSDSNLLDEAERSRLTQRNQRTLSGIFKRIAIEDEIEPKLKIVKEEQNDANRPTSVHSSVSHMSRDSGVMMTAGDDLSPKQIVNSKNRSPTPSNDFLTKQYYRPFSEFVDERTVQLSANRNRSSSESSNGTIYSEIEQNNGNREEIDPLYEDLDKFRKNIQQLLGVQCKIKESGDESSGDHPPPLPPRQYERGRPMTPVMPVALHRKDVFKYLGVVEETKKRYGSLSRLPSIYKRHSSTVSKRKLIPSYVGLSNEAQKMMAASQPSLLEITYDTPKPSFEHLQNKEEVAIRRISKSYVRVRKPEDVNSLPPPKPPKKPKKIKFPKWRRSSVIKDFKPPAKAPEETYKSFDNIEPEIVIEDDVEDSIILPVVEEIPQPITDVEQYAVPRVRKSAILIAAPIDDPIYSNLESIRLSMANRPPIFIHPIIEPTLVEDAEPTASNKECLIEEDEYADMSIRNEQRRQVQSIYLTMNTDMIRVMKSEKGKNGINHVNADSSDVINDFEIKNENNDVTQSQDNNIIVNNEENASLNDAPKETEKDLEIIKLKNSKMEEIETQTPSLNTEFDREVIKKMIFESNPQGEKLKQRLSSYIDEIFAESLLEYDKRLSANSAKSCDSG